VELGSSPATSHYAKQLKAKSGSHAKGSLSFENLESTCALFPAGHYLMACFSPTAFLLFFFGRLQSLLVAGHGPLACRAGDTKIGNEESVAEQDIGRF
jgi:hypothetical protein